MRPWTQKSALIEPKTSLGTEKTVDRVTVYVNYQTLQNNNEIVNVNEKYFRPSEVSALLGDSSLAEKELGWKPKVKIDDLISEMMKSDLHFAKTGTYPNPFENK